MKTFKLYISTLVILLLSNSAFAQYTLKNDNDVSWYNKTTKESIDFTVNAKTIITGETLYYKIYCKNLETNEISKLSKVAYVELLNNEGLIFKQKLLLNNGTGEGRYSIPKNIATGHYKLIGYTQWMKNNTNHLFDEKNLIILNPRDDLSFKDDTFTPNKNGTTTNDLISIKTSSDTFSKRSKVVMNIDSNDLNVKLGNYAVSVSKVNPLDALFTYNTIAEKSAIKSSDYTKKNIGDFIFLPETDGEIISGTVTTKSTNKPVENTRIMLSILDDSAFQDFAITNKEGRFTFTIKNRFESDKAMLRAIEDEANDYKITFDKKNTINSSALQFNSISIPETLREHVRQRSLHTQIENAYRAVKQDANVPQKTLKPFYGNHEIKFVLDDYTRFSTLAETLIEVVEHAWHERYKGKTRAINVRERENDPYYDVDILPIVIFDGAYIKDHENVLPEDANNIESISVFRDEFYFGNKVYQGALMVKSKDRNFYQSLVSDNSILIDLLKPQPSYNYFKADYTKTVNRIPDFRNTLLWLPNYIFSSANNEISFFTSDIEDNYQISLNGITKNGQPIHIEKEFKIH